MAKTDAQRAAEQRLRERNQKIYKKTNYDPDKWRERVEKNSRTIVHYDTPMLNARREEQMEKANSPYWHNAARNLKDQTNNIDPYAWQNRETSKNDEKWDYNPAGTFNGTKEEAARKIAEDEDMIVTKGRQAVDALVSGQDTPEIRASIKAYEDLQKAARTGKAPEKELGYAGTKAYVNTAKHGMSREEYEKAVEKGRGAGDYAPYLTAEGVEKNVVQPEKVSGKDLEDIYFLRGLGENEKAENAKYAYEKAKQSADLTAAEKDARKRGYISSGEMLEYSGYQPQKEVDALRSDRDGAKQALRDAEQKVSALYHAGAPQTEISAARNAYEAARKAFEETNYAYNAAYNLREHTQNKAEKAKYDAVRGNANFASVVAAEKGKNKDLPISVSGIAGTPFYAEYYKGEKLEAADQRIIDTAYYIRATQGEEAAADYLKLYSSELERALSKKWLEELDEMGEGAGQAFTKRGYDLSAGVNKFVSGMENLGAYANEGIPLAERNAIELAQGTLAEGYTGAEKLGSDLLYNLGNMAPTIAASFIPVIGQVAGLTLMGTSTLGNTYAETRREGYGWDEAKVYAAANAGAETMMQYALGGIVKLGSSSGLASKFAQAAKKAASNPLAAKGLAMLGNMTSEAAEEYLQANLDPILRNAILSENNEINPTSQDKLYSALLGALSSIAMNAPADAADAAEVAKITKTGRAYRSPEVLRGLVEEGLAGGMDTTAYRQAQRLAGKLEAGKNISNLEAGSLARANEAAIAAEARANAILDKTGAQRAYDPNETVKLKDGREVVIVARDGSEYTAIVPGENGYTRITIDEILHREGVRRAVDAYLHPEDKADITGKYDHRHVEKTADQTFLDDLQKRYGIKAAIEDMQPGAEAFYDRSTNTIHFAPDSTRADVIGGVTAHELAHAAEASEHYKAYSDYAVQRLFGNDTDALRQAVEAKQEQYIQHGVYLSDADAVSEIVADYTRNLYKSPADIEALVTGNRGMAQSIYDSIRTAIQKIRAFFKGDEAALRNIREYQDLRRAQRLFERALSAMPEVQAEAAIIPQTDGDVNRQYNVTDTDSEGRTLTAEQAQFFKNSKARDERGRLALVYHGTPEGGFSTFDARKSDDRASFWFSDSKAVSESYAGSRADALEHKRGLYQCYLNIQNPLEVDAGFSQWNSIQFNGKESKTRDITNFARENGYDGVIIRNVEDYGAFHNKQGIEKIESDHDVEYVNESDPELAVELVQDYIMEQADTARNDQEELTIRKTDDGSVVLMQAQDNGNARYERYYNFYVDKENKPAAGQDVHFDIERWNGDAAANVYVAFLPEQIKSIDNETPTRNQNIKYSIGMDHTDMDAPADAADADERLRQQKAVYEERTARDRMRRKESGERSQLLNIVRRLDKLSKKSAPEQKNAIQNLIKDIDKTAKGITRKGALTLKTVKAGYEEAAQDLNFIKNPAIEKKIERLDQKHIADMDISDVRELTDILRGIEHDIRSANREVGIRKAKAVSELSEKGISEIRNSRGASGNAFLSLFNSSSLSPTRRFAQMGGWREGSVMEYLGEQLAEGQRKAMEFRRDASGKFQDFIGQNGKVFDDWSGKKAKWIDTGLSKNGKTLQITPAMRISLYLHSLNADNMRHIAGGGITVPDQKLYKQGKIADAYAHKTVVKLTPQEVKAITDRMTPQEKEFAGLAYEFFNTDSKKAINSASLDVLGYEIANVENYMPITADKAFTKGEFESLVKDRTIEGMGMLKERENASNPILLEDITSIIPRHMENAARYYGLAAPIRNFNAVYRRTMTGPDGINDSVQNAIGNKFGKKGTEYIEKLMTDLQGGGRSTDTAFDKMRGKFAQATLGFNAGSALKQTASLPTAASTLGFKAVLGSMRGRVDSARIDANTPLLWERRQGGSTLEIGDVARNRNWEDKVPFLMKWNQSMDVAIAKRLWRAAEIYVNDHYKSLERGSAEYDAEVARWYNKAIEDTQSNYATMQRPDILRSENQMVKALTMFTTDRFQMYNILYEAGGRLRTAKENYKANPNAENRAAAKKYAQQLARSVAAVTASNAWVAAVTIGINLLLGRKDWYEDEEGDLALAESFGSEFLRNMAGTLPFGDKIYSLIASMMSDEKWYGVEAPNISMINDLAENVINMAKSVSDGGDAAIRRNAKALAMDAAKFFGIPAENIEKYVLGIAGQVAPAVKESYDNIFYPNDLGDLAKAEGREYDAVYDTVITNRMNGIKGTDAYEEIKGLYRAMGEETDRNKIFLPAVPDKVEYTPEGGEKAEYELTAEEQKQYAETQNKVFADAVNALISSKDYVKLDDEQKGYAVSVIAGMAKDDAKAEALGTKGVTMERSRTAILEPEDIALYKAAVMDYGAEGKTAQDERSALLQLDIPEERKAEVYRAVFENQKTEQNGIMRAREQGVGTETYIAFMAQPFWNDETRDDSAGGESLQAKQWLLDNAAEEEIVPLYGMKLESKDTDERNTIAYAQEQGVRPSAFVEREIQKAGEHGMPGEPEEDAIWEDGKIIVDEHGTTESGTKKAQVCDNLLNSGYTEEEKEFFYQKQYSTDDNFPYYAAAGLPVDDYLSVKGYTATLKADKDENGKSISGSKKQKLADFLEGSGMSEAQKLFFFAQEYKVSGAEAQAVREYINGLDTTDDVKEKLLASVELGGSSGGSGRRGRSGRRSSGKSAAVSQEIPDAVWNELRANVKTPTIQYDNPAWGTLKALLDRGDKIREETMQQELEAVDATPYMSSAWRAERKREIRKRYGRGTAS